MFSLEIACSEVSRHECVFNTATPKEHGLSSSPVMSKPACFAISRSSRKFLTTVLTHKIAIFQKRPNIQNIHTQILR